MQTHCFQSDWSKCETKEVLLYTLSQAVEVLTAKD